MTASAQTPRSTRQAWRVSVGRELKRIAGNRFNLVFLVVLPILGFAVMLLIFQRQVVRELPVAVCDLDGTVTSRRLVRAIAAAPTMRIFRQVTAPRQAVRLMRQGKIYAYVVIPNHFERDAKRGHKATATAYYNAQWLLPGNMLNRDLSNISSALSGAFEGEIRRQEGQPRAAVLSLDRPVAIDGHPLFNPFLDYRTFLTSALLPSILQICILLATIHALGMELKNGTDDVFLAGANDRAALAVAGKMLPLTLYYALFGLGMAALLFRYLRMPLRGSFALVCGATVLFVLAYQGVGMLFIALIGNLRLAIGLAAIYAAPAFAFTGITFPILGMPPFAKIWGALLPLTWYLKFVVGYGFHGAPVAMALPDLGRLLAFVIGCPLAAMPLLAHRLRTPALWGSI